MIENEMEKRRKKNCAFVKNDVITNELALSFYLSLLALCCCCCCCCCSGGGSSCSRRSGRSSSSSGRSSLLCRRRSSSSGGNSALPILELLDLQLVPGQQAIHVYHGPALRAVHQHKRRHRRCIGRRRRRRRRRKGGRGPGPGRAPGVDKEPPAPRARPQLVLRLAAAAARGNQDVDPQTSRQQVRGVSLRVLIGGGRREAQAEPADGKHCLVARHGDKGRGGAGSFRRCCGGGGVRGGHHLGAVEAPAAEAHIGADGLQEVVGFLRERGRERERERERKGAEEVEREEKEDGID